MFDYLDLRKRLTKANATIAMLRSIVGEPQPVNRGDDDIAEPIKLVERVANVESDVDEIAVVLATIEGVAI